jgi:hypothetical protein
MRLAFRCPLLRRPVTTDSSGGMQLHLLPPNGEYGGQRRGDWRSEKYGGGASAPASHGCSYPRERGNSAEGQCDLLQREKQRRPRRVTRRPSVTTTCASLRDEHATAQHYS